MLTVLFCVLIGFLLKLCGFMGLLGLSSTAYYSVFALFGAVVHLIQLAKRKE